MVQVFDPLSLLTEKNSISDIAVKLGLVFVPCPVARRVSILSFPIPLDSTCLSHCASSRPIPNILSVNAQAILFDHIRVFPSDAI